MILMDDINFKTISKKFHLVLITYFCQTSTLTQLILTKLKATRDEARHSSHLEPTTTQDFSVTSRQVRELKFGMTLTRPN